MPRILVTDGEQRAALASVRSLGQAAHQVYVTSERRRSLAGVSRHCAAQAVTPSPLTNPHEFARSVAQLAKAWRIDVLLPISEAALLALLAQRDLFKGILLPFPDQQTFQRVSDKAEVLRVARTLGLDVPAQHILHEPAISDEIKYPVVAKPSRSVVGDNGVRAKTVATYVGDAEGLARILSTTPRESYPILVQERIVGPGVGVFVLMWEGQLLAYFGHRRIREKPPWGGVSVYRESADVDRRLLESSVELLRAFNWNGVAMVEYKIDAATGKTYLMEINGRLWGSLQLAIDAGIDFPRLLVEAALGKASAEPPSYRAGVRSRWWWGDVDHLVARLRHSKEVLALPAEAPGRLRAVIDFVAASAPGNHNEVFRLSDPAPAILETFDWVRRR